MPNAAEPTPAKLLIVDDKTANLDPLREMLAPLGHQIFFATSGAKALGIAASVLPDLVLLDVMMPEMDGFETCRRFKQDPALGEIPIIFVTARTDVEDLAQGFAAGAVDYVTKPVKQPEVHARVATHLRIQALICQQRQHLAALEKARGELQELNDTKDKFLSNLGREVSASLAQIADSGAPPRGSVGIPGAPGTDTAQDLLPACWGPSSNGRACRAARSWTCSPPRSATGSWGTCWPACTTCVFSPWRRPESAMPGWSTSSP